MINIGTFGRVRIAGLLAATLTASAVPLVAMAQAPAANPPAKAGPPPPGARMRPGGVQVKKIVIDTPEAQKEFEAVYEFMQVEFTRNFQSIRGKVAAFAQKYPDTPLAFALVGELKFNEGGADIIWHSEMLKLRAGAHTIDKWDKSQS